VLLALGRLLRGESPLVEFAGIEDKLGKLLEEFGPSGSEKTRHNPFWHLRTDGVWQLAGPAEITSRPPGATPTITELRRGRVAGGFAEPVRLALARDPALAAEIARRILNAHFPESIRQDVATAVGLDLDAFASPPRGLPSGRGLAPTNADAENAATPEQAQRRRDPAFREKVLLAYEYRCCVCGHDLRMGGHAIGLEAAHIKWFQARGPDVVPNGLALCSLHHKIFDLGAFTVLPGNHQIVFSRHLMGGDDTKAKLLAHHGAGLIQPQGRECLPHPEFLAWHRAEVFKEPARE
jgi:putative restriction endonuclease